MTEAKTGIAVGANKGHVVTKREQGPRQAARKGVRLLGERERGAAGDGGGGGGPGKGVPLHCARRPRRLPFHARPGLAVRSRRRSLLDRAALPGSSPRSAVRAGRAESRARDRGRKKKAAGGRSVLLRVCVPRRALPGGVAHCPSVRCWRGAAGCATHPAWHGVHLARPGPPLAALVTAPPPQRRRRFAHPILFSLLSLPPATKHSASPSGWPPSGPSSGRSQAWPPTRNASASC